MKKKWWLISGIVFAFLLVAALIALGLTVLLISGEETPSLSLKKVAVIELVGPIYNSKSIIDLLHRYKVRSSVKAIVLRIDSPGGTVGAAQEIYQEVKKIRKEGKIIVVSMADVGASGAYYIACGANEIVANPGTLTGSIGVVMEMFNIEGFGNKIGLEFNTIKSGQYKDTGSLFRKMTKEEQAYLQQLIDNVQQQFYRVVVENRKEAVRKVLLARKKAQPELLVEAKLQVSNAEIEDYIRLLADGRVYSGEQAKNEGLIDTLGNLETAINRAAKLAGIPGEPSVITARPRKKTFFESLLGDFTQVLTPLKRNGVSLQYILK
ncbi:MAG: signal peptide peptidase SppA [bacterium]|nr:signal peptide peptidase SppA [bacterium]